MKHVGVTLLISCGVKAEPSCLELCEQTATAYDSCLQQQDLDWQATDYSGRDDFIGRCETWAWELSMLERDALKRGEIEQPQVDGACQERNVVMAESEPCDAVTTAWSAVPWDS